MMVDNFNVLENKLNQIDPELRKELMAKINSNLVGKLMQSEENEVQFEKIMTLILTLYFKKKNVENGTGELITQGAENLPIGVPQMPEIKQESPALPLKQLDLSIINKQQTRKALPRA